MDNKKLPEDPKPIFLSETFRTSQYIPEWIEHMKKKGFVGEALYKIILFFWF